MVYALILGIVLLFAPHNPAEKEPVKVNAMLCNIKEGPAKISDFKNCREVTLSIDRSVREKYHDARIIQYTFAIAGKKTKAPRFVEEVKGNILTQNALGRISAAAPGDVVILTNVKMKTKAGIEEPKGAAYKIISE